MQIVGVNTEVENPEALARRVLGAGGRTDADSARRLLTNIFYGAINFANPLGQEGISALPLGVKLNLYESIAREGHPQNHQYLDALNQEMGLTQSFYSRQAADVVTFLNRPSLDLSYAFRHMGTTFSSAMTRAISGQATECERRELLAYLANAYGRHLGLTPPPRIQFVHADPNLQGQFIPDNSGGGGVVQINLDSTGFKTDFSRSLNTLFHELQHGKQFALVADLQAGRVTEIHPDYVAARVFAANLSNFGYISASTDHGAYERQTAEVDARNAGELAQQLIIERYGSRASRDSRSVTQPAFALNFA
jgi:hypothetical protein